MSYNNPEYGGGGSTGANYYDPNANFSDTRYTGPPRFAEADFTSAAHHATSHHDGGNSALFDNALSFIKDRAGSLAAGNNGSNQHEINEAHAMRSHQALFGAGFGGAGESHDDQSVGAGAAMQALKLFMERGGQHEGGFDLNQLVGLAMAQAGKVWDEKEGSGASMSGDKQSAINNAAEMAMKMYLKSGGGIAGTGGPSGLMGLASKFLM